MNVKNVSPRPAPSARGIIGLGIGALVSLAVLGLIFASWKTVDPGYVGIVFDKVKRDVSSTARPGWTFINPFSESITRYPVSVQTLTMVQKANEGQDTGDDSVKVGTKEGQTMNADVSVNYSVAIDQASQLYTAWAGAPITVIESNFVRQIVRAALNDVASKYGWEEIYGERRVEYTQEVSKVMTERLAAKYIKFESLNLRGWFLPQNLQTALDAKITAQQQAAQQSFQLEQARIKATQDQVAAEGQANALRAQAQGEADAISIRAKAQADANKQLAETLTPALIQSQQLQKWDGKLPLFSGGGVTPLINASDIISGTTASR